MYPTAPCVPHCPPPLHAAGGGWSPHTIVVKEVGTRLVLRKHQNGTNHGKSSILMERLRLITKACIEVKLCTVVVDINSH